jgi:hypothetical protein
MEFFVLHSNQTGYDARPASYSELTSRLQGSKSTDREADHSRQFSAEIMNVWSNIFTPPYTYIE